MLRDPTIDARPRYWDPVPDWGSVRRHRFVLRTAELGRRAGLSMLGAAQEADLGQFAAWADAERLVLNLHRADAESAGGSMDVDRAFGDAVEWNGGPLTTHVCCGPDAAPPAA